MEYGCYGGGFGGSGGACYSGSGRSGDKNTFWFRSEGSPKKFSGGGGGGGRLGERMVYDGYCGNTKDQPFCLLLWSYKEGEARWQSAPNSDHLNQNTILSLEPRDHPKISLGHYSIMLASSYIVKSKIDIKSPTHYPRVCGDFVQEKMIRDMLTVGSTMRILLLYRGEYSQWSKRFIHYLEKQTDGEAMINFINNGDQPLPYVTRVSIVGTSSTEQPPLKDKSIRSDQDEKIQKIDRLARSLLIQGLSNDIYSLIDSNKTAKDLWDALARQMLGSEYDEQDRKASILYEYETFKATEGELLLDTYIQWKHYAKMMRQNKNLIDINIDALYNILKQNKGDVNDAMGLKKKTVVVSSDPLALIAEKTKVNIRKEKVVVSSNSKGSGEDDFSDLKKITALLAKDFNRKNFYSKPTNKNLRTSSAPNSANKKQEYVKSDDKKKEKKVDEKKRDMSKVKCYNDKKECHFAKDCKKVKVRDYEYYKIKMLLAKKEKDEQVLLVEDHAWMESSNDSNQEINANMVFMAQIEKVLLDSEASSSSADDNIAEHRNQIVDQEILFDKMSYQLVEMNNDVLKLKDNLLEKEKKISELEECVLNKDLEIEKKDIIYLEDEVVILLAKEKENLETIESLKLKGFESSKNTNSDLENQSENDWHVVENVCDDLENPNVIASGMFKLNLDTFNSVRRPKPSDFVWKKKRSSDTFKDNLSYVHHSNLNKNLKNALCNARMNDSVDVNDLFVFDDVSIRKSQVSKMIFRKKPSASLNVLSRSKLNKYLPRIVRKWLPKMKPLAKPIANWIPRVTRQIDKLTRTSNS
nr:hypothetical protein [Tanacetum cinerariifolium]